MPVLTIYTNSFPYGKAETFLETEIKYLSINFREIFIVPFRTDPGIRTVPGNVRVLSPVQDKKWQLIWIYLTGLASCNLIYTIPELKNGLKSISLFKAIKYLGYAILTKNRLLKIIPLRLSVHYSYWLNFNAFSLSLLKREGKIKILISRAHGYDLYDERGEKSLGFIRGATLKNLNRLFFISEHGRDYLLKKFPEFSDKYLLSRLGTPDPEYMNPGPDKNNLTLVSCSAINSNKRIFLILESLILFKTKYASFNVKWHHLGSGSDIRIYAEKAEALLKNSLVQCFFHGQMTNLEVFNFYKTVPVDLFVNVSENEGIPVSIMEAQSFSIPVAATNVGGISEIVNDENGILLSPQIGSEELADIFYSIYDQKGIWGKKRSISQISWDKRFNANKNYNSFSRELICLVQADERV